MQMKYHFSTLLKLIILTENVCVYLSESTYSADTSDVVRKVIASNTAGN